MSRWVSLNQARAKASANSSGLRQEAAGDLLVDRVDAQREVGREHGRRDLLGRVVGVGDGARARAVLRTPLVGARGALEQLPLVAEEDLEEVVAPLGGRGGPDALQAGGDRVGALAGAEGVAPAEALLLDRGGLGVGADVVGRARAVGLAEGVATGDEGDGLLVVHRHAAEGLTDVAGGGQRVGVAVGALGVHVDEAHLDGAERALQVTVARVALVVEPAPTRGPSRRPPPAPTRRRGHRRSRRSGSPSSQAPRCP